MSTMPQVPEIYGLMAEFERSADLVRAISSTRQAGYRDVRAYTPFPVEDVTEALALEKSPVPKVVLIGGILGGVTGYLMQYWMAAISYPINVGGRPYNSWQSFVPVTFEMTILFAGLAALISILVLNGLPLLYHPVFNVPEFARANRDRFFLCIESTDPRFDPHETREFLTSLDASGVSDVPR